MMEKKALLTIVHTEGSTWQKVGARLILSEDGHMDQMLTGGCLEKHLKDSASELCSGEKKLITFDMRDEEDALFGWGSGCGGKMVILVEPFYERAGDTVEKSLTEQIEELQRSYSVEFMDSNLFRSRIYLEEVKGTQFEVPTSEILYAYVVAPRAKVLIFGAGPDGTRLSQYSRDLGFITHLFDHRESVSHAEKFDPSEVSEILKMHNADVVVVMTHNFLVDQMILKGLSEHKPLRVLLLGPIERKNALIKDIDCPELDQLIESPLGMIAKARGSEEVALSASASILDFWKRRTESGIKNVSPESVLNNLGFSFTPPKVSKRIPPSDEASVSKNQILSCSL